MHKLLLAIAFLLCAGSVSAQDKSLFEKRWYVQGGDSLPYRLLLPENYDPAKTYPMILFLHGAGERGNDNESQLVHGSALFLQANRKQYPAIVAFPQCPANSFWSNVKIVNDSVTHTHTFHFSTGGAPTPAMRLLLGLLDNLQHEFHPDRHRMYVAGLSMGGMGTFELVSRKPKLFAAAIPICGGANPESAGRMKKVHWWVFHGLKDNVVDPALSKDMAAALEKAGADVKLTLYPEANHNSWDSAFAEKDLLPWLFSKQR